MTPISNMEGEVMFDIKRLNERARKLGMEVVPSEMIGHPFNMGRGPHCRLLRNGEPIFKFSWTSEEVHLWLTNREREAA